jgi:hypothetical protein
MWIYDSASKTATNLDTGTRMLVTGSGSSWNVRLEPNGYTVVSRTSQGDAETALLDVLERAGYTEI